MYVYMYILFAIHFCLLSGSPAESCKINISKISLYLRGWKLILITICKSTVSQCFNNFLIAAYHHVKPLTTSFVIILTRSPNGPPHLNKLSLIWASMRQKKRDSNQSPQLLKIEISLEACLNMVFSNK